MSCQAECDAQANCSGVEWYESGWNKSKCHLMLTGWGSNRATAGQVQGRRWKDAVCYVKNDCDQSSRIEMTDPEQSSNTPYNVREAGNALDGQAKSIIHTENNSSGWWTAGFNGADYVVESVKIQNRPDGFGNRLGNATVEVDGQPCGTVAATTVDGAWYTVTCTNPILGRNIKVTSVANTPLHFAEIRAFGK